MRLSRLLLFVAISSVLPAAAFAARKVAENTRAYKGAIVMDAASGQVLFEDHADEVGPPASVTKLMTFLIVQDHIAAGTITLKTPVTVTREDSKIGGTQVWLKEGEVFPVEELLYALMIQSANDAANALSHAVAGSREAFVGEMNAKAHELGMTHTTFHSPHGLPPARGQSPDLTSPRDLAILARHLLLHTDILRYTSVRTRSFGTGVRLQPVEMRNHNHLLGRIDGCDGLKTGFTNGAGFCLAATAQRGNHRIIVVVMGSAEAKVRDLKVAELIEKGFAMVPANSAFAGYTPPAAENMPPASAAAAPASDAPSPVTAAPLSPGKQAEAPGTDGTMTVKFTDPVSPKKG